AALFFPAQTSLMNLVAAPHERGKVIGYNVSIGSLFLILGPVIGGYLTEWASWRWIFWINLPILAAGIILAKAYLPTPKPREAKIDAPGFLYFVLCCGCLITAFMQAQDWGWTSFETLCLLSICLISGIFLIRREKQSLHPFLELSLFKHPTFAAINISIS